MPLQDVALIGDSNLGLERKKKLDCDVFNFFVDGGFPRSRR